MLMISAQLLPKFKCFCSSPSVIMLFVYMKCRFSLSYRDLEEMMMIRGAKIDHATLQRWVKRFVYLIDKRVRQRKKPVNGSWRMDETYIKLNGSVASVKAHYDFERSSLCADILRHQGSKIIEGRLTSLLTNDLSFLNHADVFNSRNRFFG